MRKIIQISAIGVQNTIGTQSDHVVFALCADGTLWESWGGREWQRMQPIPDGEKEVVK